jgi:hypothetical protein
MILQDALPGIKRFLKLVVLKQYDRGLLLSLIAAFVTHIGRMSASQAAGAIRSQARHRATVVRFLARLGWSDDWEVLRQLADQVLQAEQRRSGVWLFIVDQTLCGHQGDKTANTFSTGNRKRRPRKDRRYSKYKYARKRCHCFVMGLLLTPSGLRLPCFRSYYTEEYCQQVGKSYRRQTELAGELIETLAVPVKPEKGKLPLVQKILLTNCQRPLAEVVELYDLRWQIELFFKELKSTLGMHQDRFRDFAKVGSWVAVCLATFLYLEWYRSQQLGRRDLTDKRKDWWRWQHSYGLCLAVRQDAEEKELLRLADYTSTPGGLKKLKKQLRAATPLEYRKLG